jgi:hypothetical protein
MPGVPERDPERVTADPLGARKYSAWRRTSPWRQLERPIVLPIH